MTDGFGHLRNGIGADSGAAILILMGNSLPLRGGERAGVRRAGASYPTHIPPHPR